MMYEPESVTAVLPSGVGGSWQPSRTDVEEGLAAVFGARPSWLAHQRARLRRLVSACRRTVGRSLNRRE